MRALLLFLFVWMAIGSLSAQNQPKNSIDTLPGQLYRVGERSSFQAMVEDALEADVVFFGEMHDSHTAHRWQLALYQAILKARKKAPLGLEMLEADNQLAVDEYCTRLVTDKQFAEAARLWSNYDADYKPLILLARDSGARIVATNVPRRYASIVSKKGLLALDTLPVAARAFMAKLPMVVNYELPSYAAMLTMAAHDGIPNPAFVDAQALKDATMARFIAQTLDAEKIRPMLHINGSYHTDNGEGIVPYLLKLKPKVKVLIITTVPAGTPKNDWLGKGLYTLVSD